MNVQNKIVTTQKEILKRKLGGELFEGITLDDSAFTDGVCKAGNPIAADGTVDNASDPVGILVNDVYKENPNGTILKAFGVVNTVNVSKGGKMEVPAYACCDLKVA